MVKRIALLLVLATLALPSCTSGGGPKQGTTGEPGEQQLRLRLTSNLRPFDSCAGLLDYFRTTAASTGAASAQSVPVADGRSGAVGSRPVAGGAVAPEAAQGAVRSASPSTFDRFSATNVQVAGVDEPDIVKTDGRLLVALEQGRLQVLEVTDGGVRLAGSALLRSPARELFLVGSRAIVLGTEGGAVRVPVPAGVGAAGVSVDRAAGPMTTVSAFDLSDPSRPRRVDQARFEGTEVSARLHEGTIRVVMRSTPWLGGDPDRPRTDSTADWLPREFVPGEHGQLRTRPLVSCDSVYRPPEPSGVGTVSVLTIDASGAMSPIDVDTVVADAETVYSSSDTLVVATNAYGADGALQRRAPVGSVSTEVHAFDVSTPTATEYLGSGRVPGRLLDQWSLSEYRGKVRVVTTEEPTALDDSVPERQGASQAVLTVLELHGRHLEPVGRLDGLGRGQRVYAVRFFGDLGFVVTFRRTDPLYALDLSDPEHPSVAGELEIDGYSAYLHPVGPGRLLGVGQDANASGQVLGTQVSLFDVSDPAHLRRLDRYVVPRAHSTVEDDHRAFLWWAPKSLAVLPVQTWGGGPVPAEGAAGRSGPVDAPFVGAVALHVGGDSVDPVGSVTHSGAANVVPDERAPDTGVRAMPMMPVPFIDRAVVADGTLYTVSSAGVMASSLTTFAEQGWVRF